MWQKLKEQLPAVIVTALAVIGAAYWLHQQTVKEMTANQQHDLANLREETNAALRASTEETRRQIDAVNTLLKDAIEKRAADVFMTQEEVAKMNAERVNQLAEAIAQKIQPYNPLPKTPEEAEGQQNEQIDRVSSRLVENIQPILADLAREQNLTREQLAGYSQKITDQIANVLTNELASKQQLNNNLITAEAIARDSLRLSQEVIALHLSSYKDQSLVTRLLSLPANVVRDATSLSIINSTERKKLEQRYVEDMTDLEKRLAELQVQMPKN